MQGYNRSKIMRMLWRAPNIWPVTNTLTPPLTSRPKMWDIPFTLDTVAHMTKNKIFAILPPLLFHASATAETAPSVSTNGNQLMLDATELEWRDTDAGDVAAWNVSGWYGGNTHKLVASSEGERLHNNTDAHEVHIAWQRALNPSWDMQLGGRRDFQPSNPSRDWGFVSIQGLAPFFIDAQAALYIGESGLTNLSLVAGYELSLTETMALEPEIEANFYGKEDVAYGIGTGLTDIEIGIRLRYEILPQFAPYIGVGWL